MSPVGSIHIYSTETGLSVTSDSLVFGIDYINLFLSLCTYSKVVSINE